MISLAESIIQPDIGVGAFVKFNSQTGTGGGVPRRKKVPEPLTVLVLLNITNPSNPLLVIS